MTPALQEAARAFLAALAHYRASTHPAKAEERRRCDRLAGNVRKVAGLPKPTGE